MSEIVATEDIRVPIETDRSIVEARQRGRAMAASMGFSSGAATLIATAISELARNILQYAGHGEVLVQAIADGQPGMLVIAAIGARASPISIRRSRTVTHVGSSGPGAAGRASPDGRVRARFLLGEDP
jgi:hypothetical protein